MTDERLLREIEGLRKSDAKWKRKAERRGQKYMELLDKTDRLQHEIRRLEDALLEAPRYPHAIEEIAQRNIPRRVQRWRESSKGGE